MKGVWTISENHIALQCGDEVLHPNAEEIYAVLNQTRENFASDIACTPIREAFKEIRFSKIGSKIQCVLENSNKEEILLKIITVRKGKTVCVDLIDGEIIDQCIFENEWFYLTGSVEELSETFKKARIKATGVITLSQYVELLRNQENFENDTLVNNVEVSFLDKPINIDEDPPNSLNATLYAYQKTGYLWMRYMLMENRGCILGDEMGLGKTIQVITLMLEYKRKKQIPILVVAPVSLLQNWKRECEKFAPALKCVIHHGAGRTGRFMDLQGNDVVIISYSIAVNDSSLLSMIDWKLVVLDEAQNIKNPESARTKFVKKIPRRCSIAVTGTRFENHVTDIWSLVDFIIPGLFGSQSEYCSYISDDIAGAAKVEAMLSPIMIRRMVKDVAKDLPEKVIIPQPLLMPQNESLKYEEYRVAAQQEFKQGNMSLPVIQKLRMFCTHPFLCEEKCSPNPFEESIKYQRMCEILEEISSRHEKTILFTSYQKMFDILMEDIPQRFGIPVWKINGSTPIDERQTIVDTFNNYQGSVLLALNPRAAGTGLNITAANHVIHYNLEWNPALEDQASARAYRRGQEKTVFVYRLYYENTVEQIVNERIERKRKMATSAIVGTDGKMENREDVLAAIAMSPMEGRK